MTPVQFILTVLVPLLNWVVTLLPAGSTEATVIAWIIKAAGFFSTPMPLQPTTGKTEPFRAGGAAIHHADFDAMLASLPVDKSPASLTAWAAKALKPS